MSNGQPVGAEPSDRLTKIETTLWGPHGQNGVKSEVAHIRHQVGELFGRDEAMREELDRRLDEMANRLNGKLDGIYRLMATLIVTIMVGAGGIIATLVVTAR